MTVDWNNQLAEQLDWHWRVQLRPRLDGLTDDEYRWEPVPGAWNVRPRGASSAPRSGGGGGGAARRESGGAAGPGRVDGRAARRAQRADRGGRRRFPHRLRQAAAGPAAC